MLIFCKKCGKIGHKSSSCRLSFEEAQRRSGSRMAEVCLRKENLMVHHSLVPCYTNKIIGLRRIEAYHSSRLNLTIPPSDEIPACAYSSETSSDSNTYNQKTRNVPRPCSSKRKRPPFSSSSSEDEDHLDSPKPLWTRRGILQPPTLIVRKQK